LYDKIMPNTEIQRNQNWQNNGKIIFYLYITRTVNPLAYAFNGSNPLLPKSLFAA